MARKYAPPEWLAAPDVFDFSPEELHPPDAAQQERANEQERHFIEGQTWREWWDEMHYPLARRYRLGFCLRVGGDALDPQSAFRSTANGPSDLRRGTHPILRRCNDCVLRPGPACNASGPSDLPPLRMTAPQRARPNVSLRATPTARHSGIQFEDGPWCTILSTPANSN